MSDPVTPQICPPVDSEGNNLGGTVGRQDRPWWSGFFQSLFVRGKAVATLESPRFIGAPKAQSPGADDDSERIATTEWVKDQIAAGAVSTGTTSGTLTSGKILVGGGTTVITAGASSIADVLARANHTGTQTASTISDFNTAADARIAASTAVSANTAARHTQNSDTKLANGTGNEVTAADLRAHLDSSTLHRQINDSATASTTTWSSTKISSELSTLSSTVAAITVPTDAETINLIATALHDGGGITWSSVSGTSITPSTSGLVKTDGSTAITGRQEVLRLNFTDATTLTIASGSVTSTRTLHVIAAETGTSDDLVTIETAEAGDVLFLRADSGDTITLKHGTGNILCGGGTDLALSGNKIAQVIRYSDGWIANIVGGTTSGDALTTNPLSQFAATTSAQLAGVISDETGSGALVFGTAPTITLPNATGLPPAGVTFAATARILARKTASGGAGEEATITEVLDFAGATRGMIPLRGASTWAGLAIGSAGRVLESDGTDVSWQFPKVEIAIPCSDYSTNLTTGTAKATFRMPHAMTVTAVRASLATAQSSGSIFTVDINESGISILSTKLTIDNTERTSTTAATAAVISDSALADDAEITVDIDQVGTAGAKGLIVYLIGRRA